MPILRGAVSLSRFLAEPPAREPKTWLAKGLRVRAFEPLEASSEEDRSAGFVELEDHDATEFSAGNLFYAEHALFSWRVDQLKVSASALRAELAKWAQAFERDQGRPPSRVEKADRRGIIQQMFRARTTPRSKVVDVSWNLKTGHLEVWAGSRKSAEEIGEAVEKCFGVKLLPLTAVAVAGALDIPDTALVPTPELSLGTQSEVRDVEA